MPPTSNYPSLVSVTIEISRWSFVKYQGVGDDTKIDFVSVLPTPFNYGFVEDIKGGDGLPLDAVVLGKRKRRGSIVELPVCGVVRFSDSGCTDDKLICCESKPGAIARNFLSLAFVIYARLRKLVNIIKRRSGQTAFLGIDWIQN